MFKELTYDEAYYYKILIELGFNEEFEKYIEYLENELEDYEGFYLDLIYNQSNTSNIISLLNNFILDKKINESKVFEKVRLFLLDKLNNNEIDLEKTIESLDLLSFYFLEDDSMDEWDAWDAYYDYELGYLDGYNLDLLKVVRSYLETGKIENYEISYVSKEDKKRKLKLGLYVLLFDLFIYLIGFIILIFIKLINANWVDFSFAIILVFVLSITTITTTLYLLDWYYIDIFIDFIKSKIKKKHE